MKSFSGYDDAKKAAQNTSGAKLPAGAYVCKIMGVRYEERTRTRTRSGKALSASTSRMMTDLKRTAGQRGPSPAGSTHSRKAILAIPGTGTRPS